MLNATPQSPPRKTGWTIHVALLLLNQEKPYRLPKSVAFDVSGATPTTETNGVSVNFKRKLADLESQQRHHRHESVSQQLFVSPASTSHRSPNQHQNHSENEELARDRKEENITVSSLLNKKTNELIPLGHDSTIFDLKEAIAQQCKVANIFTDNFALVFERRTLPDWPSLNPKTLSELNLYDAALVYAVEFDKEQYNLRETLATRLVNQAKDQRRRRLECAFGLSQDCLETARGFSTLINEAVYPPLCLEPISPRRAMTMTKKAATATLNDIIVRNLQIQYGTSSSLSSLSGTRTRTAKIANPFQIDLNQSEIREHEVVESSSSKRRNVLVPLQLQQQQRPSTAVENQNANAKTNSNSDYFNHLSPFPPPLSLHHSSRASLSSSSARTNLQMLSPSTSRSRPVTSDWNPGSDRLFLKRNGLRGEEKEKRYKDYIQESPTAQSSRKVGTVPDSWLIGRVTLDIDE